jgi:D-tagatose-1,6-bisphosphate aldolase subunit GatZ/KbaZ
MGCAGDPPGPLPKAVVAERAAGLCQAAEEAFGALPDGSPPPCYVIGTEVPPPGGAQQEAAGLLVTTPEDAQETLQVTHQAFLRRGLEAAWERVIALVVQPGVEFGESTIHAYDRQKARPLSALIEGYDSLVYEAHSTDYQAPQALRALVEDHFAILKVGPALTFALRQALFAIAWMEAEWLGGRPGAELSRLPETLDQAMSADPHHWQAYYAGDEDAKRFARKYSLSDRSRYYWNDPQVQRAVERLFANLERHPAPPTLLSQFLPVQYRKVREGRLSMQPLEWVDDAVQQVLLEYSQACGWKNAVESAE